MTREEKIEERERFLIRELKRLQQEFMDRAKPVGEELQQIRDSRGPAPIPLPDGRYMRYTGPLPKYQLPEEKEITE